MWVADCGHRQPSKLLLHLCPSFIFPTFDFSKIALRPMGASPEILEVNHEEVRALGRNPHLRSFRDVRGYAVMAGISAVDSIGHVLDMVVVEEEQRIEEVIINTGLGHSGDLLNVRPADIAQIDWSTLHLYLSRSLLDLGLTVK